MSKNCATDSVFPECGFCNLPLAATRKITICRIITSKIAVVYTGTHDNDTTVGWFNSEVGEGSTRDEAQISKEHDFCLNYLNSDGAEIHWDFIRAVWRRLPTRQLCQCRIYSV